MKAHIIALAMHIAGCNTINSFCTYLLQSDWPDLFNNLEVLYGLTIVSNICDKVEENVEEAI